MNYIEKAGIKAILFDIITDCRSTLKVCTADLRKARRKAKAGKENRGYRQHLQGQLDQALEIITDLAYTFSLYEEMQGILKEMNLHETFMRKLKRKRGKD